MFYDVTSQILLYLKIMIKTHKIVFQLPSTNVDRAKICFFLPKMSWNVEINLAAGYKALNLLCLSCASSMFKHIYFRLSLAECAEHARTRLTTISSELPL
jgi:hypothetical protein